MGEGEGRDTPRGSAFGSFMKAGVAGAIAGCAGRARGSRRETQQGSGQGAQVVRSAQEEESLGKRPLLFDGGRGDIKDRVRSALISDVYDVTELYKKQGIWQRIARHPNFESTTMYVVILNTLWMGVDADYNCPLEGGAVNPIFWFAENAFCTYFFVEWLVRFKSFRRKRDGFRDGWFLFDTILVSMMVMETWILGALTGGSGLPSVGALPRLVRLLRLMRATRMARFFRAVPELLILIKGMMAAVRSVGTTLLLLLIVLYTFALVFRLMTTSNPVLSGLYFSSIGKTMYTLLLDGIFMDNLGTVVRKIAEQSTVCVVLFWTFVLISSLTVMNMLIGVICEVVSSVAVAEKELATATFVRNRMRALFDEFGALDDDVISRDEFLVVLQNPKAIQVLTEAGLDVEALVDQAEALFVSEQIDGKGERTVNFTEFVEMVLSMRNSCTATVKDVIALRKFTRTVISQTSDQLARIESHLEREAGSVRGIERRLTRLEEADSRIGSLSLGGGCSLDALEQRLLKLEQAQGRTAESSFSTSSGPCGDVHREKGRAPASEVAEA